VHLRLDVVDCVGHCASLAHECKPLLLPLLLSIRLEGGLWLLCGSVVDPPRIASSLGNGS